MTALQSLSNTTNALYVVPFFDTKSEISAVFPFWQRACNSSFVSTYLLFSFHTTKSQVEHHSLTSLTCRVFSPLHFGQGVLNVSDGPWSGKSRTTLNSGESLSAQSNFLPDLDFSPFIVLVLPSVMSLIMFRSSIFLPRNYHEL